MAGRAGDLVFFRGKDWISWLISLFSYWTHVGAIDRPGIVLAAEDDGVVFRPLKSYEETHDFIIVGLNRSEEFRRRFLRALGKKVGRKYDITLLIGNLLYRLFGRNGFFIRVFDMPLREICVELVASSLREAGEVFQQDLNAMSPEDLARHFGWVPGSED